MRIFDENNNLMESPDFKKGYLKGEKLFVCHHEAVEAVEEIGHYETIAEYPNGGRDTEWVVDTPAVAAQEAWDEYEDIQRYVEYTEKELAARQISELKAQLSATDYKVIKCGECQLLGKELPYDIMGLHAQRQNLRDQINELEQEVLKNE